MIGRCYVLINDRRAGSRWSAGRQLNSPDVLAESSPFLRRLVISIFKGQRYLHRVVTLQGDTAGSRGVCSLLLDSSRKTRTRIYGRLIEAVSLWSLINPHLFSIDWFPSLNLTGWSIEWSLFMETQLGPGESALCCWTLKNKHHLEVRICGYLFVLSFIAGLLNYFLMTLRFNNLSQVIEMEILWQAENEVNCQ